MKKNNLFDFQNKWIEISIIFAKRFRSQKFMKSSIFKTSLLVLFCISVISKEYVQKTNTETRLALAAKIAEHVISSLNNQFKKNSMFSQIDLQLPTIPSKYIPIPPSIAVPPITLKDFKNFDIDAKKFLSDLPSIRIPSGPPLPIPKQALKAFSKLDEIKVQPSDGRFNNQKLKEFNILPRLRPNINNIANITDITSIPSIPNIPSIPSIPSIPKIPSIPNIRSNSIIKVDAENSVEGVDNKVSGKENFVSGNSNSLQGTKNIAKGSFNSICGDSNNVKANKATVFGNKNRVIQSPINQFDLF